LNRISALLSLILLPFVPVLSAQVSPTHGSGSEGSKAFTRLAVGGGIGLMGINMQAATNVNRYLNVRGVGNYFTYSVNNVKVGGNNGSSGAEVSGNVNFAEGGVSLDYYPFPRHGFRLSPGVTFYNQNQITASGAMAAGDSITLGSDKYYSEAANPMTLSAGLGLNTHKQAFTMTTGWGNMIPRKGGHWSFPFELGAVFTGVPTLGLTITGLGCDSQADAQNNVAANCVNMSSSTALSGFSGSPQSDINAQIAKYKNDLNPLQVYPIISFGAAYSFRLR